MRELERNTPPDTPLCTNAALACVAVVGRGQLGTALSEALRDAGYDVEGPLGRGAGPTRAQAVLLCVPDGEIEAAAGCIPTGPAVGHCSGATDLAGLAPHEAFSLHPLMTVTAAGGRFAGAGAAIAGSTPRARSLAAELANALQMRAVQISDGDRAAYHAAASIASNFLITLEAAAERLANSAGADRALLVPLVRAAVENWATLGPERALTGPVARGDELTVARQRSAIAERAADLLPLFDTLVDATRALAGRQATASERPAGVAPTDVTGRQATVSKRPAGVARTDVAGRQATASEGPPGVARAEVALA
jgi:predicted short-subunit dehydrogenase-like oxidoreductase (DUF2520 family)